MTASGVSKDSPRSAPAPGAFDFSGCQTIGWEISYSDLIASTARNVTRRSDKTCRIRAVGFNLDGREAGEVTLTLTRATNNAREAADA